MKTFLVLFAIAVSLPTEAQRVKENVRQRVEIVDLSAREPASAVVEDVKENPKDRKQDKLEAAADAPRKR
jgi:hypothetical protein